MNIKVIRKGFRIPSYGIHTQIVQGTQGIEISQTRNGLVIPLGISKKKTVDPGQILEMKHTVYLWFHWVRIISILILNAMEGFILYGIDIFQPQGNIRSSYINLLIIIGLVILLMILLSMGRGITLIGESHQVLIPTQAYLIRQATKEKTIDENIEDIRLFIRETLV